MAYIHVSKRHSWAGPGGALGLTPTIPGRSWRCFGPYPNDSWQVLAVVVMVAFVLGYPLATLLYVKTVVLPDLDEKPKLRQRLAPATTRNN